MGSIAEPMASTSREAAMPAELILITATVAVPVGALATAPWSGGERGGSRAAAIVLAVPGERG